MEIRELNEFTKYNKFSSPFKKDERFMNTKELSQKLPKGKWVLTEKIDGTNIRIIFTKPDEKGDRSVLVGSRKLILDEKDKSSKQYFDCLKEVNLHKLKEYFKDINSTIIIYGEGYGAGVQKGSIYSPVKNYRVFDVRIGRAYQDWSYVEKVCVDNQLNIVPVFGEVSDITYDGCIIDLSNISETMIKDGSGGEAEGLVYKFEPILLNKYGERLIFKVKHKDFKKFDSNKLMSNNTERE